MDKNPVAHGSWFERLSGHGSWLGRIAQILDIKPGEGRLTFMALCASFFHGVSSIYLFSVSHALFLANFEAHDLPYTYIGGAFTVLLAGAAFSALQHRIHLTRLVIGTLAVLLATLVGAHLWLMLAGPKWPSAFLAVWTVAYSTLTYMSLWGLFGRVFDTRQAKRLFGVIGAGEFAADIVSGFLTPVFVWLIGSDHLLLVAALGLFLMIVFSVLVIRAGREHMEDPEKSEPEPAALPVKDIFTQRYPLLLHLLWGLSLMSFYLLDTAFSNQVERHYKDSTDAMTSFLGVFFAVGSAVNMLVETFLTGRVLHRIGILKALFILPLGVLIGCASVAACPLFMPREALAVFVLAVGVKMYDYVARNAIHDPAFQVLYQPLPLSRRFAVQSSVLTRAEPTAALIGGGALLLGRMYFTIDAVNVSAIIVGILALQTAVTLPLRSEYLEALLQALKSRRLGLDTASLYDRHGLTTLLGWLDSRHPGEVIYSLRLLEKNAPELLHERLADLLSHPSPEVQASALEGIERTLPPQALPRVRAMLADQGLPPEVRARALSALCALDEAGAVDVGQDLLDSPESPVARAAMVGLLRHCGIEGVLVCGGQLLQAVNSPDEAQRVEAASILAEAQIPAFYRTVRQQLADPSPAVRRAALLAAEKMGNPRLIPSLLPFLAEGATRIHAIRAIAAAGDTVLPELALTLARPGLAPETAHGLIKAVARMGSPRTTEFLLEHLYYPDADARRLILSKLSQRGFTLRDEEDRDLLRGLIRREADHCAWLFLCMEALPGQGGTAPLHQALAAEFRAALDRILDAGSFFCPPQAIRAVKKNLSAGRERAAYALELLDSLATEEMRRLLHPFLEDLPAAQRLERLRRDHPLPALTREAALTAIALKERSWLGPWVRSLALYLMGQEPRAEWEPVLATACADPAGMVRETALWALERVRCA